MSRTILSTSAAVLLLAVAGASCSPTREYRGFVADSEEATQVQVGVDTKSTVMTRLGSPSTQSPLDPSAWYYVASVQERFAFYRPETVDRDVLVVRFGADDVVTAVDRYGIERGRVISYNQNETPTRGRELGILEQIFGNIGQTSPVRTQDQRENPRDRGD